MGLIASAGVKVAKKALHYRVSVSFVMSIQPDALMSIQPDALTCLKTHHYVV